MLRFITSSLWNLSKIILCTSRGDPNVVKAGVYGQLSMDPVQRCVALVLVQLRSSISVQELSFTVLVVVWVPVFRSIRHGKRRRERTEHCYHQPTAINFHLNTTKRFLHGIYLGHSIKSRQS